MAMVTNDNTVDQRLFNIDILIMNNKKSNVNWKVLSEVYSPIVFKTNSKEYKEGGLYDPNIFGPIGSTKRNEQLAYIDTVVPLVHPFVYTIFTKIGPKYKDVIEYKVKAVWDTTTKDYILSDAPEARQGYQFIMEHAAEIDFPLTGSRQRKFRVDLLKKYLNPESMSNKLIVLPAGLRDYTETDKGNPSEDKINDLYRKVINIASTIKNLNLGNNIEMVDFIRLKLQLVVVEIFEYIKNILSDKSGFIQNRFAKRAIVYGTRNVITPHAEKLTDLTAVEQHTFNQTVVGLYQFTKALPPIVMYQVTTMFIGKILNPNDSKATLVDTKDLLYKEVEIKIDKRDEWLSMDGLNNILNKLAQSDVRVQPVMVDKYYLLLVYDTGDTIKVLTDNKRDGLDPDKIRPITYAELFYISVYPVRNKYPALVTRYPITGLGSIYPSYIKLKSTVSSRTVKFIYGFEEMEIEEYPILEYSFVDSLSPHSSKLALLGADHDGDVCSLNVLTTDEAIDEVSKHLQSKEFYISPSGDIVNSCATIPLDLVIDELTDDSPRQAEDY